MEDFLKKIVSAIVEKPDDVEISKGNENGLTTYTLLAPSEEIGKIIGKAGKTINAIRNLVRLKSLKSSEKVLIKIEEKQKLIS